MISGIVLTLSRTRFNYYPRSNLILLPVCFLSGLCPLEGGFQCQSFKWPSLYLYGKHVKAKYMRSGRKKNWTLFKLSLNSLCQSGFFQLNVVRRPQQNIKVCLQRVLHVLLQNIFQLVYFTIMDEMSKYNDKLCAAHLLCLFSPGQMYNDLWRGTDQFWSLIFIDCVPFV